MIIKSEIGDSHRGELNLLTFTTFSQRYSDIQRHLYSQQQLIKQEDLIKTEYQVINDHQL